MAFWSSVISCGTNCLGMRCIFNFSQALDGETSIGFTQCWFCRCIGHHLTWKVIHDAHRLQSTTFKTFLVLKTYHELYSNIILGGVEQIKFWCSHRLHATIGQSLEIFVKKHAIYVWLMQLKLRTTIRSIINVHEESFPTGIIHNIVFKKNIIGNQKK